MNAGAEKLKGLGMSLRTTVTALAENGVKASAMGVKRWQDGSRVPAETVRLAFLAKPFQIPVNDWDLQPAKGATKKKAPAPRPAQDASLASAPPPALVAPGDTATERQRDLLTRIQRWRHDAEYGDASATARAQLATLEQRAITELAALTGEKAQPDAVLLKSPQWARLSAKVLEALAPFPAAVKAVRAALAEA